MGITLSATEAARVAHVTERTMRAWLASGKVPGHKQEPRDAAGKGPPRWEIDSDALAAVPGISIDRDALALFDAQARRSPAGVLARLDALEAQVRALSAKLRALEGSTGSSGNTIAPVTRSDGQEGGLPPLDRESYQPAPYRPPVAPVSASYSLTYGRSGEDAPEMGAGGIFRTRADAGRWLMRHGVNERTPKSWPGWREVELTPRQVLGLALSLYDPTNWRIPWRLHRCEDSACVCHELLT